MEAKRAQNVPQALTRQPLETASVSIVHRITRAAEAHLLARAMLASARQTAVLLAVHDPQKTLTRSRLAMCHALRARAPDLIAEVRTTAFALPVWVRRTSVLHALRAP